MSHVTDHLELRTAALLQQQAETALESNRQLALLHLAQRSSSVQRALSNPQKSPIKSAKQALQKSNRQLALLHLAQRSSSVQRALQNSQKSPIKSAKPALQKSNRQLALLLQAQQSSSVQRALGNPQNRPINSAKKDWKIREKSPIDMRSLTCVALLHLAQRSTTVK